MLLLSDKPNTDAGHRRQHRRERVDGPTFHNGNVKAGTSRGDVRWAQRANPTGQNMDGLGHNL
jgi:hypothetical protein